MVRTAGVEHRKLKVTMRKHKTALETFGLLASYGAESTGGRPEEILKLNEQQATFLMTLLKNTPVVVEFKKRLVQQFFSMRQELSTRQLHRAIGKPIRRTLTDAIRDSGENERMHGHAYSTYTDFAYRLATGKAAQKLRKERGVSALAAATDFLTADEMQSYNLAESRITMLLDMRLKYERIKELLLMRVSAEKVG